MYCEMVNIKIDLTVKRGGGIVLSSRLAAQLGAEPGDVPTLRYEGDEVLIGLVPRDERELYTGRLYRRGRHSGTMTCNNKAMADALGIGARYRCGSATEREGRRFVNIITRKNYGESRS